MANLNDLILEDVPGSDILFRNFSGNPTKFKPEGGNREFAVVIPHDLAADLEAQGWSVRFLNPRDPEDKPTPILTPKVNYRGRPPQVVLVTGRKKTTLTEDTVQTLDWVEIESADLIIHPYEWEVGEKRGVKPYVQTLYVKIKENKFDLKYADLDEVEEEPQGPFFEDSE